MLLVGTNHLDIDGPARLEYLLDVVQPRSISIELPGSPDEVREQIKHPWTAAEIEWGARTIQVPDNETYRLLFRDIMRTTGYEATVGVAYADAHGIPVYCVDLPSVADATSKISWSSEEQLGFHRALLLSLIPDGTERMTYEEARRIMRARIEGEYRNDEEVNAQIRERSNRLIREVAPNFEPHAGATALGKLNLLTSESKRDEYMAQKIRELHPDIHIGGTAHIRTGDDVEKSLVTLLSDLEPRTILLCDAFAYQPATQ